MRHFFPDQFPAVEGGEIVRSALQQIRHHLFEADGNDMHFFRRVGEQSAVKTDTALRLIFALIFGRKQLSQVVLIAGIADKINIIPVDPDGQIQPGVEQKGIQRPDRVRRNSIQNTAEKFDFSLFVSIAKQTGSHDIIHIAAPIGIKNHIFRHKQTSCYMDDLPYIRK